MKYQEKDESNQVGIDADSSDNPNLLSALPALDVFDFGADEFLFPSTEERPSTMKLKDPELFREKCFTAGAWSGADDGQALDATIPATSEEIGTATRMGARETRRTGAFCSSPCR